MSAAGAIPARAAYVAAAARAVGEPGWSTEAASLLPPADVRGPGDDDCLSEAPRYRDLARAGVELVEALADAGRWNEAASQARHLTRYFTAARARLHAVAGESFDGLHAAARAHDRNDLQDFAELLRELFP